MQDFLFYYRHMNKGIELIYMTYYKKHFSLDSKYSCRSERIPASGITASSINLTMCDNIFLKSIVSVYLLYAIIILGES